MKEYRCQGVITVFLSLISVLFLSLICTLAESARVQGAKAWAAAVTDMGVFSVFGEYERDILEKYNVLFLDGAYGSGEFLPERTTLKIKDYMNYNINPEQDLMKLGELKMFPLLLENIEIPKYTLATDENGAAFYQQAVRNLKENIGAELVAKYLEESKQANDMEQAAKDYEEEGELADKELAEMERQAEANAAAEEAETETTGTDNEDETEAETEAVTPVENPLEALAKIKEQGILNLVVKDPSSISTKEIELGEYPSKRELVKGNQPVERKESGILADALFSQYLLEHFPLMTDRENGGVLNYQLEYILMGKNSDIENLKSVVHRLLLLREGANFLYAMGDSQMRSEANTLGTAIAAAIKMPMFAQVISIALLLGWAYGESLLDVRTLLAGGKVPLMKSKETWQLSLANLGRLLEILTACDEGGGQGQSYEDYLRVMLLAGGKAQYPMRALDMIEGMGKSKGYRADHWIVDIEIETEWTIKPMFLNVARTFLGTESSSNHYTVNGNFAY